LARAGKTGAQIAKALNVERDVVGVLIKMREFQIPVNRLMDPDKMRELLLSGMTLQQVGDLFGVTRERIRQITGGSPWPGARRPVKLKAAKAAIPEVKRRVRAGETMEAVCRDLEVSFSCMQKLGVKSRILHPPLHIKHGTVQRYNRGCRCARCRKVNSLYRHE
jgi:transcriptional regulator with XRE-family HTH domain